MGRPRQLLRLAWLVWVAVALALVLLPRVPYLSTLARLALGCAVLVALVWLLRLAWRKLLWRVGRRLAFSYFLIGVLPIPMVALMLALAGALLAGSYLGHLYRDALGSLDQELAVACENELALVARGETPAKPVAAAPIAFAYYRHGRRAAGDPRAPADWPAWLAAARRGGAVAADENGAVDARHRRAPFIALADGGFTLAEAAGDEERGVVALFAGDLEATLSRRTRLWIRLYRSDDPQHKSVTNLVLFGRRFALQGVRMFGTTTEHADYLRAFPPADPVQPRFAERPLITWTELTGPLRSLADGQPVADHVAGYLTGAPRAVRATLLSSTAEVDTTSWLAFGTVAVLLTEIYLWALGVALFMIYGLSRAVNRLSRATETVARGDFSVRIPVRRKDQLGELQRSFNQMAEHLQELVATAVEKEAIEKELAIAHQLQRDLLPQEETRLADVRLATHFEPSAAIGGDYYDLLTLADGRLALIVADVSGHGLPAGLRMAMLKSALRILVEEGKSATEILGRLAGLVRSGRGDRTFVTATLAIFDGRSGRLELTNAGHPPTYVVRGAGNVEEIVLPGAALGTLRGELGRRELALAPGDAAVWLSDGLFESTDARGEAYGYERVRAALAGPPTSAEAVRDRLLASVAAHDGGRPADDDRTLVVLLFCPTSSLREPPAGAGAALRAGSGP